MNMREDFDDVMDLDTDLTGDELSAGEEVEDEDGELLGGEKKDDEMGEEDDDEELADDEM